MKIPNWQPARVKDGLAIPSRTIDIWLIDLNPADYEFPRPDESDFAADELERASRFRFDRHRRQYLVGRDALRGILAGYTGDEAKKVQFQYGEFGKPALDPSYNLSFNLSNSHEMALIAITKLSGVGADIEFRDRHMWEIDSLAKTVFTDEECAELNVYPSNDRLIPFLSGWTRKEAYLKAIGKGLALPLKGFSVQLDNSLNNPQITVPEWNLLSFWATEDYICSVAYPAGKQPALRWFKLID